MVTHTNTHSTTFKYTRSSAAAIRRYKQGCVNHAAVPAAGPLTARSPCQQYTGVLVSYRVSIATLRLAGCPSRPAMLTCVVITLLGLFDHSLAAFELPSFLFILADGAYTHVVRRCTILQCAHNHATTRGRMGDPAAAANLNRHSVRTCA
jgi:hypothetical protein